MSIAIGSNTQSSTVAYQPSRVSLDAELARYRKQLSDSVNCPSSKTLEGKLHIQELSDKISATQSRIKQAEAGSPSANTSVVSDSASAADNVTYNHSGETVSSSGQGNYVDLSA